MSIELGQSAFETVPLSIPNRRKHVYVAGKTGQGKSVLLENMALDDLAAGRGFAFLDPHGTSAERIADSITPDRMADLDVIYFDPADKDTLHFNPLECELEDAHLIVEQLITMLYNIWPESWGPNLEYILHASLRLLMANPGTTLLDLKKVLVNRGFRSQMLQSQAVDDDLRSIWEDEFAGRKEAEWRKEIQSTINKVGRLVSNPVLRNVFGRPSTIDIQDIMDNGKCLIVNLDKGKIGTAPCRLIGATLLSAFQHAAERRGRKPRDFAVYVDEFQNFVTGALDDMLAELRKRRLNLIMAHQYEGQLPEGLRKAALGNAGTIIAFQVGAETAEYLAPELDKTVKQLTNLDKYHAYIKLPEHDARHIKLFPPKGETRGTLPAVKANTLARYTRPVRVRTDKMILW